MLRPLAEAPGAGGRVDETGRARRGGHHDPGGRRVGAGADRAPGHGGGPATAGLGRAPAPARDIAVSRSARARPGPQDGGCARRGHRRGAGRSLHDLRGRRLGQSVEDREQRDHLDADLRARVDLHDWRRGRGAVRPPHRLGGYGRDALRRQGQDLAPGQHRRSVPGVHHLRLEVLRRPCFARQRRRDLHPGQSRLPIHGSAGTRPS